MTREQFITRWQNHVAGVIALGSANVRQVITGPFKNAEVFGAVMNGLGDTSKELLGKLYDDLTRAKGTAKANDVGGRDGK